MTLVASGTISIGGTTANASVEQEIGATGGFTTPFNQTASLNDTSLRTLAGIPTSGAIISLSSFYGKSSSNLRAIIGYGAAAGFPVNYTTIVSSAGVVGATAAGVGTARQGIAACAYGGSSAGTCIFMYGYSSGTYYSMSNLVSNAGVVAADTTGVGTTRGQLAAAKYSTDKGVVAYGANGGGTLATKNLISNTGVIAADVAGVGTARASLAALDYGTDKAIFAFGKNNSGTYVGLSNLVSNTGVIATDTAAVGSARWQPSGVAYGTGGTGIFLCGEDTSFNNTSTTNLVSNTGVIASDTASSANSSKAGCASGYGTDTAIYFSIQITSSKSNLISNTGVVAATTTEASASAVAEPAAARFGI